MAISAGPPEGAIQRGRGGFYRNAQGTPYVTDPSGALVKTGDRKGQPKRVPYGSPSGAGKQIEDTYNLAKWSEREILYGVGVDPALFVRALELAKLDKGSDEFRTAADRLAVAAKDAARTALAADRGTHAHALTEDYDENRDWITRAEAGEVLGIDLAVQRALVAAWRDCLDRNGLEMLAVEEPCVDDVWRLAGTLDRIARCTQPLRFALPGGELVDVPAGTVLVLDVKSGQRRTRNDGSIQYWQGYAVQIASYAQSVPYDLDTETRGRWPWVIDQDHALIAHLDVLGAIDGNPSCELVHVDLIAGRTHGGATWQSARAWGDRRDVFSAAQVPAPDAAAAEPAATVEPEPAPVAPAPLTPAEQHAAIAASPDEGGPADPDAIAVLQRHYGALDAAGATFIRGLISDATRAAVSFHLKGNATVRRFEVVRGLVTLAAAGTDDTETLRCVLASVIGDVAHYPAVTAGHLVGSLSAGEAAIFARRCDELVSTTVPADVDPDTGTVRLRFADLAAPAA